jgi:hypothetical protein
MVRRKRFLGRSNLREEASLITFSLGIPHCPWKPERVLSLSRLVTQLGLRGGVTSRLFTDRAPNWQWSSDMWRWAAESGASHFVSLQDDAIVSPRFWIELTAMVEVYPNAVIGLESVHPQCTEALERGDRMITTSDGLIGVGYVVPVPKLRRFLEWRGNLIKGAVESITEDTLLCVWCISTGERIYHPVPTIIDHDTDIPSTYDNDAHKHRRPLVTWRVCEPGTTADWWRKGDVQHVGSFYDHGPARLARRWIRGATDEDWERWRA